MRALGIFVLSLVLLATIAQANFQPTLLDQDLFPNADGSGAGGGGGSGRLRNDIEGITSTLDTGILEAIRLNVTNVKNATLNETLRVRDTLNAASNLSNLVAAALNASASHVSSLHGTRTNLTVAIPTQNTNGFAQALVDLYRELGEPLTPTQELSTRASAASVPNAVAQGAAIMTYAIIDAIHYRQRALETIDAESAEVVLANISVLSTLHRRMQYAESNGNLTLTFSDTDQVVLRAAANVTNEVNTTLLAYAADVIAQAIDQVKGIPVSPTDLLGSDQSECVETLVIYSSRNCLVIIGASTHDRYFATPSAVGRYERSVLVIDFGGSDQYQHRAGGGVGCQEPGVSVEDPCKGIQVNLDLGAGNDQYRGIFDGGAAQGAGSFGVGFLYDAGGRDVYTVVNRCHDEGCGVIAQGGAFAGSGLLVDEGGNDAYFVNQTDWHATTRGQGVGEAGGFGLLDDKQGDDTYAFEFVPTQGAADYGSGGAQAYASFRGSAFLLDRGQGNDTYTAGQSMVQAAATWLSYAFLWDAGGNNAFSLRSSLGCSQFSASPTGGAPLGCAIGSRVPIARWGQGYAGGSATATFLTGSGTDTFSTNPHAPTTTGLDRWNEGRRTLGVGNTSGLGILIDLGGNDLCAPLNESAGYGNAGIALDASPGFKGTGIFIEAGGTDTYRCISLSCHGYAEGYGLGVYYDGLSDNDTYDGATPDAIFTNGNVGIGYRQSGGTP